MLTVAVFFLAALQEPTAPAPATLAQDESPAEERHFTFMPGLRVGGWWMGSFEATTPLGGRKIESSLYFDAGIDLRAEYGGWSLALSADYAAASDVKATIGGVLIGKCWQLGDESPWYLQVAAGPIFGKIDVSTSGFGDFKSGVGGEVRISATVEVHDRIELMLWMDVRQITFDYDEPVVSGDKDAGGASFAVGAGFLMRF
jgi:hypothetical protein